jgi:hypothetical protein
MLFRLCFGRQLLHDCPLALAVVGTLEEVINKSKSDVRPDELRRFLDEAFEGLAGLVECAFVHVEQRELVAEARIAAARFSCTLEGLLGLVVILLLLCLMVSLLVGTIRTIAEENHDPKTLLKRVNERLIGRTRGGFTTALAASVSPLDLFRFLLSTSGLANPPGR